MYLHKGLFVDESDFYPYQLYLSLKPSSLYLGTDHKPLTKLYRRARQLKGVKRIFIASGLRYDLAVRDPEYIKELVTTKTTTHNINRKTNHIVSWDLQLSISRMWFACIGQFKHTIKFRRARQLKGVKRIFIASGLRYDLAVRDPEYIKELVTHHVGGRLTPDWDQSD
jgi:radical SAM superfamily enzyme YgiQ (UPF0313 family)